MRQARVQRLMNVSAFAKVHTIAPALQRWSYGSGTPPHADYRVVPKGDRKRLDEAMSLLERVAADTKNYPFCHKFFKDQTPGGTAGTFADLVTNAIVWRDTDNSAWASSQAPKHIAYSDETWRWGRWSLAGAFVHEMMHNAGQHNEKTNDTAITTCGFPDIQAYLHKVK
ncbi:MAG: hypothetical protein M3Q69_00675 [Acidobacteriota bacterium]|nr:hypothetical protein [Acidobacteriota bacterium]